MRRDGPQELRHVSIAETSWHQDEAVAACCEHPILREIFAALFGEPAVTYDFKWVRGMPPGGHSAFHMDKIYMGKGSDALLTCWIPLQDVSWEAGGLVVCEGSSSLPGFQRMRETYAEWDVDYGDRTSRFPGRNDVRGVAGVLTSDAASLLRHDERARWLTAAYRQGDILIFTMKTLHGSVLNTAPEPEQPGLLDQSWRLSIDVRFQPGSEPLDPRYSVEGSGLGAYPEETPRGSMGGIRLQPGTQTTPGTMREAGVTETRSMYEARKEWGILPPEA